jgi:drug/metabolite transporter (DMT)-like permease
VLCCATVSIVDEFGAVVANLAGTARRAFSLAVSFLFFPKPFTVMHGVGVCTFFAGLLWNSQRRHAEKERDRERRKGVGDPKKTQ